MESNGISHRLNIQTVSAGCTGIEKLDAVKVDKEIPQIIMSLHALVFIYTGTVGIHKRQGLIVSGHLLDIAVFTVDRNSALFENGLDSVFEPVKSLGISHVKLGVF